MYDGPGKYVDNHGARFGVIGLCRHAVTGEQTVVYCRAFEPGMLVSGVSDFLCAPLALFNETIDGVGGTPIDSTPRFHKID